MALPDEYATYDDYFNEALNFLNQNQFLYNYANVDILVNGTFDQLKKMHDSGSNELYKGNSGVLNVPSVKITYEVNADDCEVKLMRGLSDKKIHEILKLSELIGEECERLGVSKIIDIGSGLGYLSQLLYTKFGFSVIGIEGSLKNANAAIERQKKYFNDSLNSVRHVHHFLTIESKSFLNNRADEYFGINEKFVLSGLHACGDLTIDAIKLFSDTTNCLGIIIMPCCYHKMKFDETGKFINLPLSRSLKDACDTFDGGSFIRLPLLRLACQRTQWITGDERRARIFNLLSRAVLQLYAFKDGLKLAKKKRKGVNRSKSNQCDFEAYLNDAISSGYFLVKEGKTGYLESKFNYNPRDGTKEESSETSALQEAEAGFHESDLAFDREKVLHLWRQLQPVDFEVAGVLLSLQDGMQAFCENLILVDKLAYLSELEGLNFKFAKIVDDAISPRCHALIASKINCKGS